MKDATLRSVSSAGVLDQLKGIALFTALISVGAQIYIPHEPVPFTLQTLFVILAGAFLGWRNGILSVLLYLFLGAVGVPIFAGPTAGFSILLGTTAGYLFGFVLAAGIVGAIIKADNSILWTLLSMFIGFVVIFACGAFYLDIVYVRDWHISMVQGFLIFSYWDLIKLAAAVGIYRAFLPRSNGHNVS
ncbi:MAG TPA: biotin transporter BioY [Candidatus Acidoferrales bacterium]|nr:biotin transporter BioY [Candidatus Acidoferrales bacterium]